MFSSSARASAFAVPPVPDWPSVDGSTGTDFGCGSAPAGAAGCTAAAGCAAAGWTAAAGCAATCAPGSGASGPPVDAFGSISPSGISAGPSSARASAASCFPPAAFAPACSPPGAPAGPPLPAFAGASSGATACFCSPRPAAAASSGDAAGAAGAAGAAPFAPAAGPATSAAPAPSGGAATAARDTSGPPPSEPRPGSAGRFTRLSTSPTEPDTSSRCGTTCWENSYTPMPSMAAAIITPARLERDSRMSSVCIALPAPSCISSARLSSPASRQASAGLRRKRSRNAGSASRRSISLAAMSVSVAPTVHDPTPRRRSTSGLPTTTTAGTKNATHSVPMTM